MNKNPIISPTVSLCPLEELHLDEVLRLRNEDETRVHFLNEDIISDSTHIDWFNNYKTKKDDLVWVITHAVNPAVIIGVISLYNINTQRRDAELGRILTSPSFRRSGFMFEAIGLVVRYAMDCGIDYLYLSVKEGNVAAINLYKKAGFKSVSNDCGVFNMSLVIKKTS